MPARQRHVDRTRVLATGGPLRLQAPAGRAAGGGGVCDLRAGAADRAWPAAASAAGCDLLADPPRRHGPMDDRAWAGRIIIALGSSCCRCRSGAMSGPTTWCSSLHLIGPDLLPAAAVRASSPRRCSGRERIKMDQVLGGVVLYLNIGLTFATTYTLFEQRGAGRLPVGRTACRCRPLHPSYFIYFSLVTLTTVGYGDIVPVDAAARSLATLEAAWASSTRRSSWRGWSRSRSASATRQRIAQSTGSRWRRISGRAAGDL